LRLDELAFSRLWVAPPEEQDGWREVLVEDHRVGPAQTAMMRLDFASWLSTLTHRDRQIAEVLAGGESGLLAAQQFGVAPSRITQLRRKALHALVGVSGRARCRRRVHCRLWLDARALLPVAACSFPCALAGTSGPVFR
jgi:hypothetical protein